MTDHEIAAKHCCNWHKKACVFDKPCTPDKCKHWSVVAAAAGIAASSKLKGAKR